MSSTTTPAPAHPSTARRRGIRHALARPLAAGLAALLATATLTLGAVAPAQAADYAPPATVNLVKGQDVGELVLVPEGAYEGWIQTPSDQSLPPGLSRDTDTSEWDLIGTPTQAGIFPFWIELQYVKDGPSTRHPVEFRVADVPVWTTESLSNGRVGSGYGTQLGVAPFADSFAVISGSVPPGLSVSSTGYVSGIPTAAGSLTFSVAATNSQGTAFQTLTLNISAPPTWNSSTLPPATEGVPYDHQLDAPGATSFALPSGSSMPPGLSLDSNGWVTGTPTWPATVTFTVNASNDGGTTPQALTLTIAPATPPAPVWQTTALPAMQVGVPFSVTLEASNTTTFTRVGGTIPAGLQLVGHQVTGTPTAPGAYSFTIAASGPGGVLWREFTGTVAAGEVEWVTETIGPFSLNSAASVQLEATNATRYEVALGPLPDGLTLTEDGLLHGAPSEWGPFTVVLRALNADGSAMPRTFVFIVTDRAEWVGATEILMQTGSTILLMPSSVSNGEITGASADPDAPFTVQVTPDGEVDLTGVRAGTGTAVITYSNGIGTWTQTVEIDVRHALSWVTESLGTLREGVAVEIELEADHAAGFAVTAGALPAGLELGTDGTITGTPEAAGPYAVHITAQSTVEGYSGATRRFAGDVAAPVISWVTDALGPFSVASEVRVQLEATDATGYEVVGDSLPAGLTLTAGGLLQGTPIAAGTGTATIRALNAGGEGEDRDFDVEVIDRATWRGDTSILMQTGWTVRFLPSVVANGTITEASAASGAPVSAVVSSAGGVDLHALRAGTGVVTVEYTNGIGTWTHTLEIEVGDAPAWVTESFGALRQGVVAEIELEADRAESFAVTAGTLPLGLTLDPDGTITGTPEAFGPYDVTISANSAVVGAPGATRTFTGTVAAPLVVWVTEALPPVQVGEGVHLTLEATNATEFEVTGDALPAGLSLTGGAITGTPTTAGMVPIELTARNADGEGAARAFELEVREVATWVGETSLLLTTGAETTLPAASVANGTIVDASVGADAPITAQTTVDGGVLLRAERAGTGVVTVAFTNGIMTSHQDVTVEVVDAPAWVTDSLGGLREGVAVEVALDATNAVSFAVSAGELPAGLTLAADGSITGTPEAFGPYDVTIAASNGDTEVTRQFAGTVAAPLPVWTTEAIGPFGVTTGASQWVFATNAVSFELVGGTPPAGITFDDGWFTGTPTAAGTVDLTLRATNATGDFVDRAFTVEVIPAAGWVGESSVLLTTGADASVAASSVQDGWIAGFTPDSSLPVNVVLRDDALELHALHAGSGTLTVGYTNGVGWWTQEIEIEVRDAPVWVTDSFFDLREGDPVDVLLEATHAVGFAIVDGALPAGVELTDDGRITGSPTELGRFDVTVAATNGDVEVPRTFFGFVSAPLVEWVTEGFEALDRNVEVELPLDARHAEEFVVTEGELPTGLALTDAASIAGTPTESGTFAFEITAYNATGESFAREFELIVEQPELSLVLHAEPGDAASGIEIRADASGLAPSSAWSVVLHSDPVEVAGGDATDDGGVEASATLPTPVPFGAHELRFSAVAADGVDVRTSVWFSVGEAGVIEEISTSGPVTEPTRTPPSPPASGEPAKPAAGEAGRIASTGVEPAAWLVIAGALLLAGVAAIAVVARVPRPVRRR